MDEDKIRGYFSHHWAFRLVTHSLKFRFLVIVGIPVIIFVAGCFISAVLGVFEEFALNPLAYGGPLAASIALTVFCWYAIAFPRILLNVYHALEKQTQFEGIVKDWADRLMNQPWIAIFIAIPIAALNLIDLTQFWANPQRIVWPGTSWTNSSQAVFFALYYGLFSVIITALILSMGAVAIIASVLILFQVLNTPIRLAHFRQLRSVGDLSIGLALWTFIPVVLTVGATFLKEKPTTAIVLSGTLQSLMVAAILLLAFIGPILIARQAIIDAKFRRFDDLGKLQDENYEGITQLLGTLSSVRGLIEYHQLFYQLRKHLDHIDIATDAINEIDSIPNWPVGLGAAVQLAVTGIIPVIGFIITLLRNP